MIWQLLAGSAGVSPATRRRRAVFLKSFYKASSRFALMVVDEKVVDAYVKMLESHKEVLDSLNVKACPGCPGQPGDPVADRIKGARSKLKQIFQIKRTYVQLRVRG